MIKTNEPYALFDGCVFYWSNDRYSDDQIYQTPYTEGGTPTRTTDRFGAANGAWNFDANTEYIDFGVPDHLQIGNIDQTRVIWFYPTSVSATRMIFADGVSGTSGSMTLAIASNKTYVLCGWQQTLIGLDTITVNTWNCFMATYDASATTLKIYLNGELDNSTTSVSTTWTTTGNKSLGRYTNVTTYNYLGNVDEAGIWARCLSADEAKQYYDLTKIRKLSPFRRGLQVL